MVAKSTTKPQAKAKVAAEFIPPVRVDEIPKQVRKSGKLEKVVAWLTTDENIGGTFLLPPRCTAAAVKKALAAAGYESTVASRAENGTRNHYAKAHPKTAQAKK